MKRMVTDEQIIDLIKKYAPGLDPSTIEDGDILQNEVLGLDPDGELVKGNLFGKYVKIVKIEAFADMTVEERIATVTGGCFIEGIMDLAWGDPRYIKNPIIFPAVQDGTSGNYICLIEGTKTETTGLSSSHWIRMVKYYPSDNYFRHLGTSAITFGGDGLQLTANYLNLKGYVYPNYPNQVGKRYYFAYRSGGLTWHEGNGLFLHSVVFDVGAGQSFTIRLISDSATTCALDADTGNFTIPDSTFIQPANMGNVVIVPLDANKFAPDIHAFDSATGAFTDNITLASVTSDTVTPIG